MDVAHVGQAHPRYTSRTADYPHCFTGKVAEANDMQNSTGKEFLENIKISSRSCN